MQQEDADVGILVRDSGRESSIIVWREHWVKSELALPGIESAMKQHDLGESSSLSFVLLLDINNAEPP